MHTPATPYLLLALLPLNLATMVSQISDGQIQEPAEAPAVAAPKIAIAPTVASKIVPAVPPPAAPPIRTSTTTSSFTPPPAPPTPSPPALKEEAGATAAPPPANASIPAPVKIEEAATTAPILFAPAPAANATTAPPHHANYEFSPHPSASVGNVVPAVENGTAPTVPVAPALPTAAGQGTTGAGGRPEEAGTTRGVATGVAARVGVSVGFGAIGVLGLAVVMG